jgi:hypothetical protein
MFGMHGDDPFGIMAGFHSDAFGPNGRGSGIPRGHRHRSEYGMMDDFDGESGSESDSEFGGYWYPPMFGGRR